MPAHLRRLVHRLINTVRPGRADQDLAREFASHLRLIEDDFRRQGMTPDAARRAARRTFGGIEQARERHRDTRALTWLDDAVRDVRHGARMLRGDPLFTVTAALSLAIAIGAKTTAFTVAEALLFQPPAGIAEPRRLVDVGSSQNGGFGPTSYPTYLDLRQRATMLAGAYAYSRFPQAMSLAGGGESEAENIFGVAVTVNYFTVLGAVPAAGRLFDASDSEQPAASPIAVISHGFWTRRFHNDPAIAGRPLRLNGEPFTIVGVASQGFHGTGVRAGEVWVPVTSTPGMVASGEAAALTNRAAASLLIGGRLKPGVQVSQAAAETDAIGRTLEREHQEESRNRGLRLMASSPVPGNAGPLIGFLALVTAIVSLVLVVACANVAGVLLARATARRQEIAVRLTLGAGRGRLVRQLLTETILLFGLGAGAGLWLARGLTSLLVSRLPGSPFPVDVSIALDIRAVFFSLGLALAAAVLSGLAPAFVGSRADIAVAMKADTQAPGRLRLRHAFVVAQVAISILLVVLAGLCGRALRQAASGDPGFDPHGVELASLNLLQAEYTGATGPRFVRDLVERVRQLPDVQAASIAATVPGGFETRQQGVTVPGMTPASGQRFFGVDWNIVEPGYFPTLRIRIVRGRDFTAADRDGAAPVAIVGEGVARQFWPGEDATGKYLMQPMFGPGAAAAGTRTLLVVGVVRDVRSTSLIDGLAQPAVYVPLQQQYTPGVTIVARTSHGQRIAEELRALVASMDSRLPVVTAQTLEDSVALGLTPQRLVASVAGALGLVGLLLATIGIYGVIAYVVTRRTREIGVRIALGARRADVIVMVLRQGMLPVAVGAIAGLILAAAAARLLSAFLFGVPPIDPVTFAAVAALFALIALAACYAPVRRATRIDPTEALKYE